MKYTGIAAAVAGAVGTGAVTADSNGDNDNGRTSAVGSLELLGHDFLENPPGVYTYGAVREDGKYGLLGGYYGEGGSFLVDLSDLENPEQAHRIPSENTNRQNDVKFDPRDGLYYRTQEANVEGGEDGFQVIDYGYSEGSVEEPEIIATVETPRTGVHKLEEHPEKPLLYPIDKDGEEPGILLYDVSDPASPEYLSEFGPDGYCHDLEVDIDRELIHAAYIGGDFVGYIIFDIGDPRNPEELSRVDYADLPTTRRSARRVSKAAIKPRSTRNAIWRSSATRSGRESPVESTFTISAGTKARPRIRSTSALRTRPTRTNRARTNRSFGRPISTTSFPAKTT